MEQNYLHTISFIFIFCFRKLHSLFVLFIKIINFFLFFFIYIITFEEEKRKRKQFNLFKSYLFYANLLQMIFYENISVLSEIIFSFVRNTCNWKMWDSYLSNKIKLLKIYVIYIYIYGGSTYNVIVFIEHFMHVNIEQYYW